MIKSTSKARTRCAALLCALSLILIPIPFNEAYHCLSKGFLQGRKTAMLGSFLLPFRHLPLDHPWIDPVPSHRVVSALRLHFPQQPAIPLLEPLWGRAVTFRQPALEDLEAPEKRQPIWVQAYGCGGLNHQRAGHEMLPAIAHRSLGSPPLASRFAGAWLGRSPHLGGRPETTPQVPRTDYARSLRPRRRARSRCSMAARRGRLPLDSDRVGGGAIRFGRFTPPI